ncbi:MAG TPA: hypothetical protein VIK30_07020, partial [Polyangia bacterium]
MKTSLGLVLAVGIAVGGCGGQGQTIDGIGDPGTGNVGGFATDPLCASGGSNGRVSTGAAGDIGTGLSIVSSSEFPPTLGTTYSQPVAPPAVSGGTLLVLADGKTAVAADPDRDRIYVADLLTRTLKFTIALDAGDEPGRVVEDAAGHVQVALRHGGALLTADPATGAILARRPVCAAPRGLAYDPATDLVHVACHDGQLVSLPAAGGSAVRTLKLDDDLRDVVVSGSTLLVSRFRSAELLTVAADGTVATRVELPAFSSPQAHSGQLFTASVAWRTLALPNGGVAILHQRGLVDQVQPVAGGYGGLSPCDAIVHPAITTVAADGTTQSGPALAGLVLAVDMAIAPDGKRLAVISTGNATNAILGDTSGTPALTRVFVSDLTSTTDTTIGCQPDGTHGPCSPPGMFIGGLPLPASSGGIDAGATDFGGTGSGGAGDAPRAAVDGGMATEPQPPPLG